MTMKNNQSWHKSSYSGGSGSCVEVAEGRNTFLRDTQNRAAGHLGFETKEWAALLSSLRTN